MGRGDFTLLLGPMFGGKTSRLLSDLERQRHAGRHALLIRYAADTRYTRGNSVSTHAGLTVTDQPAGADMGSLAVQPASELCGVRLPDGVGVVGVDEGQFFPDLEEAVAAWTARGVNVYIAALNGDYERRPFPQVSAVLGYATAMRFLPAVCRCGEDAPYTMKIVADEPVDGRLIGGSDKFRPMCAACYALNRP